MHFGLETKQMDPSVHVIYQRSLTTSRQSAIFASFSSGSSLSRETLRWGERERERESINVLIKRQFLVVMRLIEPFHFFCCSSTWLTDGCSAIAWPSTCVGSWSTLCGEPWWSSSWCSGRSAGPMPRWERRTQLLKSDTINIQRRQRTLATCFKVLETTQSCCIINDTFWSKRQMYCMIWGWEWD